MWWWCGVYDVRSSHRDSFRKYLFFFSRSNLFKFFQECPFVPRTDMNFPGGSICSSNRHEFSRRVYLFVEQTWIFQEGLYVLRTDTNFPGGLIKKTCFFKEVLVVNWKSLNGAAQGRKEESWSCALMTKACFTVQWIEWCIGVFLNRNCRNEYLNDTKC